MDVERVYVKGWNVDDFDELRPNSVLVEPVLPPEKRTASGLVLPGSATEKVNGKTAQFYKVLQVGAYLPERLLHGDAVVWPLACGDLVVVRNGMLEPLHPSTVPLLIDLRYVLARLTPAEAADTHDDGERPEEEKRLIRMANV